VWFLVGSQGGFLLIPVARDRKVGGHYHRGWDKYGGGHE
jgi:hypothetical protein